MSSYLLIHLIFILLGKIILANTPHNQSSLYRVLVLVVAGRAHFNNLSSGFRSQFRTSMLSIRSENVAKHVPMFEVKTQTSNKPHFTLLGLAKDELYKVKRETVERTYPLATCSNITGYLHQSAAFLTPQKFGIVFKSKLPTGCHHRSAGLSKAQHSNLASPWRNPQTSSDQPLRMDSDHQSTKIALATACHHRAAADDTTEQPLLTQ